MSRTMAIARLAMATMCALSCAGAAFAQDDGQDASQAGVQTVRVMTGLQHFFKRVLTEDQAVDLAPGPIGADGFSAYVNLPGAGPGTGAIGVVNGPATLINVRFTAESQCANGGADFGWCGVRILVNGIEAQPAPADYAFDSTNNGGDGTGSWEGHAMDRHLCVRNPSPTGAPCRFNGESLPESIRRPFQNSGWTTGASRLKALPRTRVSSVAVR